MSGLNVHNLWRTARSGVAWFNRALAEGKAADEAIFSVPERGRKRSVEIERRIAEARAASERERAGQG